MNITPEAYRVQLRLLGEQMEIEGAPFVVAYTEPTRKHEGEGRVLCGMCGGTFVDGVSLLSAAVEAFANASGESVDRVMELMSDVIKDAR